MPTDLPEVLADAKQKREYCYSIFVGQHRREVQRKDTIALSLYSRCLQSHEGIEILVSRSLIDDAWVLLRAMIEHAINSAYMLLIADSQTASDFADYRNYTDYEYLQSIKCTDERAFRHQVPIEVEEKARARYGQVRSRYDSRRGTDKWCPNGALWKRADLVDKYIKSASPKEASPFLWLANTGWRMASDYTHGAASVLFDQVRQEGTEVTVQRIYKPDEGIEVLNWANFALYAISVPIDVFLGGKNVDELNRRNIAWASGLVKAKASG